MTRHISFFPTVIIAICLRSIMMNAFSSLAAEFEPANQSSLRGNDEVVKDDGDRDLTFCLPEGVLCLDTFFCCDVSSSFVPLECRNFVCQQITATPTGLPTQPPTPPPPTPSPTVPPPPTPPPTAAPTCAQKDGFCMTNEDCCPRSGLLCNTWDGIFTCYEGICGEENAPCLSRGDCCPTLYCDARTFIITPSPTASPAPPPTRRPSRQPTRSPVMGKKKSKKERSRNRKRRLASASANTNNHPLTPGMCVCKKEGERFCSAFQPCCFGLMCINDVCMAPMPTPTPPPTSMPTSMPTAMPSTSMPVMDPTAPPTAVTNPPTTAMPTTAPVSPTSPPTTALPTAAPVAPLAPIFDTLASLSDTETTFSLVDQSIAVKADLQNPDLSLMVFAPNNAGLALFSGQVLAPAVLEQALDLHLFTPPKSLAELRVLAGNSTFLQPRLTIAPPVPVTADATDVFIRGAQIIASDIAATNGIIHVIDGNLIPF